MSTWAHTIRAAIDSNRALAVRDAQWRQTKLSDLAFAISTRLGYSPDIIDMMDDNLRHLGEELRDKDAQVDALMRGGYVFTFSDYRAVRLVLVAAAAFIAESRACFENLADFYREFVWNYFDVRVGNEAAGYTAIAGMTSRQQWATNLKTIRDEVLHDRSLWIAFEVRDARPRYEPLLLLNWRPGQFQPDDCVTFQTLRDIRDGLAEAALHLRHELIKRVETVR
jgi:hypothetical protein